MLEAFTGKKSASRLNILCLGAHSDDIEIGCGGTVLRLLESYRNAAVHWLVFSGGAERAKEAQRASARFLKNAKTATVDIQTFRDSFFPYQGVEIKECFEALKSLDRPDIIFTHHGKDAHQDHRLICELTWNTFRSHTILEYEIPKYDGDLGQPNFFVPLSAKLCRRKVDFILKSFPSQQAKQWFTSETFMAMLRLRGIEANGGEPYAEAFHSRKLVWRNS